MHSAKRNFRLFFILFVFATLPLRSVISDDESTSSEFPKELADDTCHHKTRFRCTTNHLHWYSERVPRNRPSIDLHLPYEHDSEPLHDKQPEKSPAIIPSLKLLALNAYADALIKNGQLFETEENGENCFVNLLRTFETPFVHEWFQSSHPLTPINRMPLSWPRAVIRNNEYILAIRSCWMKAREQS